LAEPSACRRGHVAPWWRSATRGWGFLVCGTDTMLVCEPLSMTATHTALIWPDASPECARPLMRKRIRFPGALSRGMGGLFYLVALGPAALHNRIVSSEVPRRIQGRSERYWFRYPPEGVQGAIGVFDPFRCPRSLPQERNTPCLAKNCQSKCISRARALPASVHNNHLRAAAFRVFQQTPARCLQSRTQTR